jgi:hypothetical protein
MHDQQHSDAQDGQPGKPAPGTGIFARLGRYTAAAVMVAGLSVPSAAHASSSAYADTVLSTPGLQHYLRLGDSGQVVDPYGAGRRVTDLGPAARTCSVDASHYAEQVTLGHPGALTGDADTAAGFDGATADRVWGSHIFVECGVPGPAQDSPFTMEAWVKAGRLDRHSRRIFSRETNFAGTLVAARTDGLVFSRYIKAHDEYVWERETKRYRVIHVAARWNTLKAPVAADTWVHVVGAYDGRTMRLIVIGKLAGEIPSTVPVTTNTWLYIGAGYNGYLEWDGLIDEAATYNQGLTVAQAAAHYTAGGGE